MTKNNDRKNEARHFMGLLDINYTTAQRLLDYAPEARAAKIAGFPTEQIKLGSEITAAGHHFEVPRLAQWWPWNWHPETGFVRRGRPQTPRAPSGYSSMNRHGIDTRIAFVLGSGRGGDDIREEWASNHPANAFLSLPSFGHDEFDPHLNLDLGLVARLGAAARSTDWITRDLTAQRWIARRLAEVVVSTLTTAADEKGTVERGNTLLAAQTIIWGLQGTQPKAFFRMKRAFDENRYKHDHWHSPALSHIASVVSEILTSLEDEPESGAWSTKKMPLDKLSERSRFYSLWQFLGPIHTSTFIAEMTELFDGLYLLGYSRGVREPATAA